MIADKDINELQSVMASMLNGKSSFKEALELSLTDILALSQVAKQLAEQGQVDKAQTLLEGLVTIDPTNPYLMTCLGCVYMQKKQNQAASAAFGAALSFNPNDIVAHTYSGEIALESGDLNAALKHFQRAIELDAEGRDPWANRARTSALLVAAMAKEVQEKGPGVLKEIAAEAERLQKQPIMTQN
jgi:Flp pilus assembly protein TadD